MMANNVADEILRNYGGACTNDLISILGSDSASANDISTLTYSPYIPTDALVENLRNQQDKFTVFSINAQSINSKFSKISVLLSDLATQLNFRFSAICIQETWVDEKDDVSILQIPGYKLIRQGLISSKHGGLFIYLQDKYSHTHCNYYKPSALWEGLFVNVEGGNLSHKITIGNIYRPPRFNNNNDTVRDFLGEIAPIVRSIGGNNNSAVLVGDFNLDLLQVDYREVFQEYLDLFMNNSFYPKLTFPTRFSERRATLIDQSFCKLSKDTLKTCSGIILSNISDHLPYFTCIDACRPVEPTPKFVRVNLESPSSIHNFSEYVKSQISNTLFANELLRDPNENYDKLEKNSHRCKGHFLT